MAEVIENISPEENLTASLAEQKQPQVSFRPQTYAKTRLQFVIAHNKIEVKLSNEESLSALRLEIMFPHKFRYRVPELHPRLQGLNSYINFQENILTVVLLDIDGRGISPGEGTIISIPLNEDQDFQIAAAFASSRTSGICEIDYSVSNYNSADEFIVLEQSDPNPFSNVTKIEFKVASDVDAKIVIYDVGGALIRTLLDSALVAGVYRTEWDGKDDTGKQVDSGIYFYRLYAGVYSMTKKMIYLK